MATKTVDDGMPIETEAYRVESESSLIERVAGGQASAVEDFLRLYGSAVFRFVYRRVGERHEDAEDLTQDTFLAAVSLADTFDGSCSVMTWLCCGF